MDNLPFYQDLMATVVKARMQMEVATAQADLLQNIFLVTLDAEHLGTQESFVERCLNRLELDLLDARDAPEQLRDATAVTARAIWAYRHKPISVADQDVRDAFARWEAVFHHCFSESPADAHMDIENARCLADPEYYSEPPLPFVTRARIQKVATGSSN